MACSFQSVISPKVRQWAYFSHEMEMLLEEHQCYWKLLVAETQCSALKGRPQLLAEEIHGVALDPILSEPHFSSWSL